MIKLRVNEIIEYIHIKQIAEATNNGSYPTCNVYDDCESCPINNTNICTHQILNLFNNIVMVKYDAHQK